jgi:hypothetical protein
LRGPEIGHIGHPRGVGLGRGKAPRQQVGAYRQAMAGVGGGPIATLRPRARNSICTRGLP